MADQRYLISEETRRRIEQVFRWTENFSIQASHGVKAWMKNTRDGAQIVLTGTHAPPQIEAPRLVLCKLVEIAGVAYGKYKAKSLTGPSTMEETGALNMPEGMTLAPGIDVLFANLVENGASTHGIIPGDFLESAWGIGVQVGVTEEGLKRVFGLVLTIGCAIDEEA